MTKKQVLYLDGGWETCPNCGFEMHIGDCFKVHKCLICGHPILPCDICKMGRIEAITKKKIGFHTNEDKKRLYYARLCEVFPIEIKELRIEGLNIYINNDITLEFKCGDFEIENFHHTIKVSNCFDESVILREWHLHLLQHIFKALDIKYTINIKK